MKKILPHTGFFFLLGIQLILSFATYKDYGINWDEKAQRIIGVNNALWANHQLEYALLSKEEVKAYVGTNTKKVHAELYTNPEALQNYNLKQYGPVFELFLLGVQFAFHVNDEASIFHLRHLLTHLFFLVGVTAFYFLLFQQFKDWKIALLGMALLLLCPRIYGHSFHNSKDIPFLAACILATYSLFQFLKSPGYIWALTHAFICAFTIDIRVAGLVFPVFTLGLLSIDQLKRWLLPAEATSISFFRFLFVMLFYGITLALFTTLFWPYMWADPIGHLSYALESMSRYPWGEKLLFQGIIYEPINYLPWTYFPIWFFNTIPLITLAGGLLFLVSISYRMLLKKRSAQKENSLSTILSMEVFNLGSLAQLQVISFTLFLLPWSLALLNKSVLYDDWRHFYFVYPFFLICSLSGWYYVKNHFNLKVSWFYGIFSMAMVFLIIKMAHLHPYEATYFNGLSGKAEERFELEYYGTAYKEALEYLIAKDRGEIKLHIGEKPGEINRHTLTAEAKSRLVYVEMEAADYFVTSYRAIASRANYLKTMGVKKEQEIYRIERSGNTLLSIFLLKE